MLENGEKNEETVSVDESNVQNDDLQKQEVIEISSDVKENPAEEQVETVEVRSGFVARFTANLIDQVILLALTLAVFFAVKGILYLLGLLITKGYEPAMFLIEYVVLNLLYVPITESTKLKKTLGKELLKVN